MTKPTWHADLGDALSLEYPDKYFDLVISSPFYEDCRTYAEGKEDPGIALKTEEWVRFMRKATHEALRVCKGLVCWVVEGRTRNFRYSGAPFLLMADLIRDGVTARKPMIYERKGIPGSGGPDWVRNDWEAILCFTNGGKLPYANPLAAGTVPKWGAGGEISHRLQDGQRVNSKRRATRGSSGGDTVQKNQYKVPPLSNPGNVIKASYCRSEIIDMLVEERKRNQEALDYIMKDQEEYSFEEAISLLVGDNDIIKCKVGGGLMGSQLAHENEAPFHVDVPRRIIQCFCPPSGKVCDPFGGSGTTLQAGIELGCDVTAIDIRPSQVELMKRRAMEAVSKL